MWGKHDVLSLLPNHSPEANGILYENGQLNPRICMSANRQEYKQEEKQVNGYCL